MKIGKVPESVLKRSVLKQIHTKRNEVLQGAAVGEDCAAMKLNEDEIFVISTDPITGTSEDIGSLAIQVTLNDLASAGAEPVGVMLTVLLPQEITEQEIRTMVSQAEEACRLANVQITYGGDFCGNTSGDYRNGNRKSKRKRAGVHIRRNGRYGYRFDEMGGIRRNFDPCQRKKRRVVCALYRRFYFAGAAV